MQGIDLAIPRGCFFGLLGPNGEQDQHDSHAVDTTSPNVRGGVGGGLRRQRANRRAEGSIGVVFQDPALDRSLSAAQESALRRQAQQFVAG